MESLEQGVDMDQSILSVQNITNHTRQMFTQDPPIEFITFQICFLCLAFLIVVSNIAVLVVYFRTSQLHTNDNYLLINLAFADLFAGAVNIPLISASSFKFGKAEIPLFFMSTVISDLLNVATELNLFLVCLNRYLTICHPIRSRTIIQKRRMKTLIGLAWSISVIIAFLPLTWWYDVIIIGVPYTSGNFELRMTRDEQYATSVTVCFFLLPSIAMFVFLVSMIYSINQHIKKRRRRSSAEAFGRAVTSRSLLASYVKACVLLLALYILMLVAWTPLMAVRFCIFQNINLDIDRWVLEFFVMLRFITSFINPFIYTFIKPDFRQFLLQKMLHCQRD